MNSIEQQIESLTQLFNKGILPEKIYHERVNKLLDAQWQEPVPQPAAPKIPAKEKITADDWLSYNGSAEDIAIYPAPGTVLRQRYLLESKAGQGGMGIVYKALDQQVSEAEGRKIYCAIKILAPILQNDPQAIKALKREAGRSKQLSHDNIVNVYDFDTDGHWNWIQMEWLEGQSLASQLADRQDKERCFSEQEILQLLPPLTKALSYAHNKHIIHRDIKPANIFQCTDGRLVLLDFGIARILNNTLSQQSLQKAQTSGTYEYMPPEAFYGAHKACVLDDVYALAVSLYELISGSRPYSGPHVSNRSLEIEARLPRPEALQAHYWQVLKKALSFDTSQRPQSIKDFSHQLLQAKKTQQTKSTHPNNWQCPVTGIEFIKVKAGSFIMGSPESETERYDNETQHKVTLSKDYYLGKYAVTQKQWQLVMGDNPSEFKDCGENCPVESVSWDDVQEFINRLNKQTDNKYGYCLPTEAQWEYACRAGSTTAYSFGKTITPEQVNFGSEGPVPVGSLPANAWGFYELHGNVLEWVQDWYAIDYYKKSPESDPTGPSGGSNRGIRGGSWVSTAGGTRSAFRDGDSPGNRDFFLGFRLARSF